MNIENTTPESQRLTSFPHAVRKNTRGSIIAMSTCMAFQMTGFVMILPLFARRFGDLGAGVQALGISDMIYAIASAAAAPIMGALADRFGRKALILASLAVNAAVFCGYLFATSVAAFILLRGLAGVFTAGLVPAITGLTADQAPRDRHAQWIGYVNAGASIGWIAGPLLGGIVYDRWGYSAAVMISIIMAVIALLIAFKFIAERRPGSVFPGNDALPRVPDSRAKSLRRKPIDLHRSLPASLSSFIILFFISFAVLLAWSFIEPRFMFYVYNELGWSSSMLGLAMSTYGIALFFGEILLGGLSDRVGRKPVIIIGLLFFSAQFIGMAFFRNYILVAATFIIAGLGNSLYDPALSASILDISPVEHHSRILGIRSMAGSTGSILGYALIAMLSSSIDARYIFLVSVGFVIFTTLVSLLFPQWQEAPFQSVGCG